MKSENIIIPIIRQFYPNVQAIYMFGSYGTEYERADSDVDIAVLLPPVQAKSIRTMMLSECHLALANALHRVVDLVNIRHVSTVFQKEIITSSVIIFNQDSYAVDEFEMLVFSFYQKLNEERREILEAFYQTGKAYDV
jgi:predicted nucleotidyltransferase